MNSFFFFNLFQTYLFYILFDNVLKKKKTVLKPQTQSETSKAES